MRIFHKDHGYHFVTDANELAALTALGWVDAPKGHQKDRMGTIVVVVNEDRTLEVPARRGRKPRAK